MKALHAALERLRHPLYRVDSTGQARRELGPLASWLIRRRLDVPEVHALLDAEARMLDAWADSDDAGRKLLWQRLHAAGKALHDLTYGVDPTLRTRLSYWVRPYDQLADRRRWRWQPAQRCGAPPGLVAALDSARSDGAEAGPEVDHG